MEHLARFHGAEAAVAQAEADFRAGIIDTHQFTDRTAMLLLGLQTETIERYMQSLPLVAGCAELIREMKGLGLRVILNTIGYRPLLTSVVRRLGVEAVSGVELVEAEGAITGVVARYFPLQEKIAFAERHAVEMGGGLGDVIAVGDGLSDIPLFEAVGASIAFNADPVTESQATVAARGRDCNELRSRLIELIGR